MNFHLQRKSHYAVSGSSYFRLLVRLVVLRAVLLAVAVVISVASCSEPPGGDSTSFDEFDPSELIAVPSAVEAQLTMSGRVLKINSKAFNQQRQKEIANDSEKLLTLAIALKTELDRNPGEASSANAAALVRKIEKLAHKVKKTMTFNPGTGPL